MRLSTSPLFSGRIPLASLLLGVALLLGAHPAVAQVEVLINEFQPNPPGGDPSTTSVELKGTAGDTFSGTLLSIEAEGSTIGRIDRLSNVTGTFDDDGLLVVMIPDLENPSFTFILATGTTASIGDDIDQDNDGTADNIAILGTVLDAIGVPDEVGDEAFIYGADLGGTDFAFTGDEPQLVFRDGRTGDLYAVNDPVDTDGDENPQVIDVDGNSVAASDFDQDPTQTTFGAVNPTTVKSCDAFVLSDFDGVGVGNNFSLRNVSTSLATAEACSFVATYTDVYFKASLGFFDFIFEPGQEVTFSVGDLRDNFSGLALLDREMAPTLGATIMDIQPDIVASLVYLSGNVVYGFFHRDETAFQAQCADYDPMRLHPFAQSQCAPSRSTAGADGPVALSHAELTAMALAEVEETASSEVVPVTFALSAAYPNPLNQRGALVVEVPEAADVRVVVYDVLGRQVATLADAPFEAGRHEVTLDASALAPGTYVVRATAGSDVATKRITVVR